MRALWIALLLGACATGPSPLELASAQADKEEAGCPKAPQMAFVACSNEIRRRLVRPHFREPHVFDVAAATRASVAGKVDRGEMRREDADLVLARTKLDLIGDMERRSLARRAVEAQEEAAGPVTCTRIGNSVSCY